MRKGWICLHRCIVRHWIWQDANRFKWWIDLLLRASSEDKKMLFEGVYADYEEVTVRKKRMEKVREDKYYNALQIKYATAITGHKSQGGQWKCVFIDNPFWQEELTLDDLKWLYTAITRASEKVYLVNFKDEVFQ